MPAQFEEAFEKARAKEVDLYFQEVSLMRQLVRERQNPLELLRDHHPLGSEAVMQFEQ